MTVTMSVGKSDRDDESDLEGLGNEDDDADKLTHSAFRHMKRKKVANEQYLTLF